MFENLKDIKKISLYINRKDLQWIDGVSVVGPSDLDNVVWFGFTVVLAWQEMTGSSHFLHWCI